MFHVKKRSVFLIINNPDNVSKAAAPNFFPKYQQNLIFVLSYWTLKNDNVNNNKKHDTSTLTTQDILVKIWTVLAAGNVLGPGNDLFLCITNH